ncbi:DsrE family protein [Amnibacterium sp. CER49]|uniref:DsrE family protein n=1 Tax=Amnibacterium sp. CER49 TaxID=3039161 RepID=UPI00244CE770|nr:DsrE family protein [Amnibacterium sp. CER49]MDH2442581.1 DsrE family protein [Amnibacterium sp. CER49]
MTRPKTVVHVFHDDADSPRTGSRVAQRVAEVAAERGVEIEVFCFGPAQRRLAGDGTEAGGVFNDQIDALVASGVRVGACVNSARAEGTEAALRARGVVLSVARDEFVRFTLEGATVITF